jgi:hypothetical protein
MYINSMGGSLIAGLAIFDMMRSMKPRMFTVCMDMPHLQPRFYYVLVIFVFVFLMLL